MPRRGRKLAADFLIASKEHQTAAERLANAQILALVVMSTSSPKPRVESSNLSAPATKTPEIARFRAFFSPFEAVRGLAILPRRRAKHQIVHCVTPFLNASVWYSIKRASGACRSAANKSYEVSEIELPCKSRHFFYSVQSSFNFINLTIKRLMKIENRHS